MHSVMSSLEFMQRLAALVPRRRLHLIWFHGVLAPNAKLRALVVPHGPEQATGKLELTATRARLRAWPAGAHQLGRAAGRGCAWRGHSPVRGRQARGFARCPGGFEVRLWGCGCPACDWSGQCSPATSLSARVRPGGA